MTEFWYKIFHFHDSENQGPNNDPYSFSQNIPVVLEKKLMLLVLLFLVMADILDSQNEFIILKPCSLVMMHVKFENSRCSGFRE